jgi:transposase
LFSAHFWDMTPMYGAEIGDFKRFPTPPGNRLKLSPNRVPSPVPFLLTRNKRFLRYYWPKITVVCHTDTYLFAGCVVSRGPSNDSPEFGPAVRQAHQCIHFKRMLADAGYDGQHNHRLCREELGITESVIALNKRRSRKWPRGQYRRLMKEHFPEKIYDQRWHVESAISQNKRVLGSALRACSEHSRQRESLFRILTHDLMILRRAA